MRRGRLPLTALRTFEAAGRLLSFSHAAEELLVSQAAVSRQVRELEAWLGGALFLRLHRRVELTEDGRRLLDRLTSSFDDIDREVRSLRRVAGRLTLIVSAEPSFAACWLVPRLADFRREWPDVDVEIEADTQLADFRSRRVDLAIRYSASASAWPHAKAEYLADCVLGPVLAPSLLAPGQTLSSPELLAGYPLLHEESRGFWAQWFGQAGVAGEIAPRGPIFQDGALAIQAALHGHGVALADRLFVQEEIASGQLIRPFPTEIRLGGYWLLTPDRIAPSRPTRAFAAWVKSRISSGAV